MKEIILILSVMLISNNSIAQQNTLKKISKNRMNVSWYYVNNKIFFEMSAPTNGWVTIGFNTKSGMVGAYLLMGNIINNKVTLVEHYTKSPGNYFPISKFGAISQVENVEGVEKSNNTTIKFSLPIKAFSKYQKDLTETKEYIMIIAYSQEDDFQHHSIMRTSINVKL
jgi:hypothetical protein